MQQSIGARAGAQSFKPGGQARRACRSYGHAAPQTACAGMQFCTQVGVNRRAARPPARPWPRGPPARAGARRGPRGPQPPTNCGTRTPRCRAAALASISARDHPLGGGQRAGPPGRVDTGPWVAGCAWLVFQSCNRMRFKKRKPGKTQPAVVFGEWLQSTFNFCIKWILGSPLMRKVDAGPPKSPALQRGDQNPVHSRRSLAQPACQKCKKLVPLSQK